MDTPDILNLNKPGLKTASTLPGTPGPTQVTEPVTGKHKTSDSVEDTEVTEFPVETATEDERVQEYLTFLEKHDITQDDIASVLDTLVTDGDVKWGFNLLGRIPVVFRVRPTWVNTLLLKELEVSSPKLYTQFNSLVGMYNLAGSLEKYGDRTFALNSEDDFRDCLTFVRNLSFILQSRLIEQLAIFDRVISVATSDWAVENFTTPRSED